MITALYVIGAILLWLVGWIVTCWGWCWYDPYGYRRAVAFGDNVNALNLMLLFSWPLFFAAGLCIGSVVVFFWLIEQVTVLFGKVLP